MKAFTPDWVNEFRSLYLANASNQFLLKGNVHDALPLDTGPTHLSNFVEKKLLGPFEVVVHFNIGTGLRVHKELGRQLFEESKSSGARINGTAETPTQTLFYFIRFLRNITRTKNIPMQVAVVVTEADLMAPNTPQYNPESNAVALALRDWSNDDEAGLFNLCSVLVVQNLNDLNPLLTRNPKASVVNIPLPTQQEIQLLLTQLGTEYPLALKKFRTRLSLLSGKLIGVSLQSILKMVKIHEYNKTPIDDDELSKLRKQIVEAESKDLIEFVESKHTLNDIAGQERVVKRLREDLKLFTDGNIKAVPKGILICGPVGTGKSYLAECLAGEANVPVVKFRNFRDKWVGSTESNLEKIFLLLEALGKCFVFIDEADQTLGKRDSGPSGGEVSGRVYSMIAQQMSRPENRGQIIWLLATSRPDLVEVDLKRPGRIDVKIPLFPTLDVEASAQLLSYLLGKADVPLTQEQIAGLGPNLVPLLLTPGAAEAIASDVARARALDKTTDLLQTLRTHLTDYQPPIDPEVIHHQMQLAATESTSALFVPDTVRSMLKMTPKT